jgi:hypothetical protein
MRRPPACNVELGWRCVGWACLVGCSSLAVAACSPSTSGTAADANLGDGSTADADAGEVSDLGDGETGPRKPMPGDPCTTLRDCDDGIFCDGVEECISGRCISARNAACRDHGGCAASICEEAAGGCRVEVQADGAKTCPSGQTCAPELGCLAIEGCTSPTDAKCDDGRACTIDSCEVATGICVHTPNDASCPGAGACGIGSCVGTEVSDPSGCAVMPDASRCAKTQGCDATFACTNLASSCASDLDCADGTLCDGVERCVGGRCQQDATRTRCEAVDACHHASCIVRALGDPYCADVAIVGCKG